MVKIALCDNDFSDLEAIGVLLERYRTERNRKLKVVMFHDPLELLSAMEEQSERFDILFLDILMPFQNGIETAAEIRQYNKDLKIIFLTSSLEFGVQAFSVNAYQYLLKPISVENFFPVMDALCEICDKERASSFLLHCKSGIVRVEPRQIEYCEIINRTLLFHLTSGQVLECTGNMGEMYDHLAHYGCFLRVHRSYFINMDYVRQLSYRSITMSCLDEIPLPRGKYNEVKRIFLAHAFQEEQVGL